MLARAESIDGGFADPVFDAQAVFRAVMDAMARPGTVQPVRPLAHAAAAAVADRRRRGADAVRSRHAALARPGAAASAAVATWLGFHTGAPLANTPADAHFALVADPAELIALENFAQGTQEYPDRSTTLILQVASLSSATRCCLEGPGIETAARRSRRRRCRAISSSSGSRTARASRAAST